MKKIIALNVIFALTVFVLNGVISQASNQDSFYREAAQSSLAEIALGNLALQKSQNEQVRSFAQQMVTDHTAANQELSTVAAGKNVSLPAEMDAKHRAATEKLNGLSGTEFDKAYMKQMVKDHEAAVKLFSRQADRDDDAEAKAFAAKTLPTLQGHLQMARATYDAVRGSGKTDRTDGGNTNRSDMNMNSNSGNTNMNTNRNTNSNSNSNRNNNTNSNMNRNNNTNSNANTNSNVNRM